MGEINKEKDLISKLSNIVRQTNGLLLATSFSMIIFILSFIKERTLYLQIGVFFLVLCVITLFELLFRLSRHTIEFEKEPKNFKKKLIYYVYLSNFGSEFFFLGLIFLFRHFELIYLVYPVFVYLIIEHLYSIIKDLKEFKEFNVKHDLICSILNSVLVIWVITVVF